MKEHLMMDQHAAEPAAMMPDGRPIQAAEARVTEAAAMLADVVTALQNHLAPYLAPEGPSDPKGETLAAVSSSAPHVDWLEGIAEVLDAQRRRVQDFIRRLA